MQVQFSKPVTIGPATYGVGVHDVPTEDTKNNWFFDALVEEGSAIILRADDVVEVEAEAEPETEVEPEVEAEAEPETEPEVEPEAEPQKRKK